MSATRQGTDVLLSSVGSKQGLGGREASGNPLSRAGSSPVIDSPPQLSTEDIDDPPFAYYGTQLTHPMCSLQGRQQSLAQSEVLDYSDLRRDSDQSSFPIAEITQAEYANYVRMFKAFDIDGSGTIDIDELANILHCLGVQVTDDDLASLHKDATPDEKGEIHFPGFIELMCIHKDRLMKEQRFDTLEESQKYVAAALRTEHVLCDSPWRWGLDGLFFCAVTYYAVVIGLELVKHPVFPEMAERNLEIVFHIVFWADIAINFHTLHPELLEDIRQRPQSFSKWDVALVYLRGGFAVDLVSSIPFHLYLWQSATGRGLRVLKLLKLLRVRSLFACSKGLRTLTPGYVIFIFSFVPIVRLMFFLCLGTHWFCVVWMLLSDVTLVDENDWPNATAGFNSHDKDLHSLRDRYVEALYVVLYTITTVGYGDVDVTTKEQRLFACFLFIMGAIINGFVISKVNKIMSSSDVDSERRSQMVEMVNILHFYRIPSQLTREILSFQFYTLEQNLSSGFSEVIRALPKTMQDQLSLYVKLKLISQVPFFDKVYHECKVALALSLQNNVAQPLEFVICAGEVGEEMFFLGHGVAEVLSATGTHVSTLRKGDFFGEIALVFAKYGSSRRTASVRALTYCDLFSLGKNSFLEILARFPRFRQVVDREAHRRRRVLMPNAEDGNSAASEHPDALDEALRAPVSYVPVASPRGVSDTPPLQDASVTGPRERSHSQSSPRGEIPVPGSLERSPSQQIQIPGLLSQFQQQHEAARSGRRRRSSRASLAANLLPAADGADLVVTAAESESAGSPRAAEELQHSPKGPPTAWGGLGVQPGLQRAASGCFGQRIPSFRGPGAPPASLGNAGMPMDIIPVVPPSDTPVLGFQERPLQHRATQQQQQQRQQQEQGNGAAPAAEAIADLSSRLGRVEGMLGRLDSTMRHFLDTRFARLEEQLAGGCRQRSLSPAD